MILMHIIFNVNTNDNYLFTDSLELSICSLLCSEWSYILVLLERVELVPIMEVSTLMNITMSKARKDHEQCNQIHHRMWRRSTTSIILLSKNDTERVTAPRYNYVLFFLQRKDGFASPSQAQQKRKKQKDGAKRLRSGVSISGLGLGQSVITFNSKTKHYAYSFSYFKFIVSLFLLLSNPKLKDYCEREEWESGE